jgi:hypothetical protein
MNLTALTGVLLASLLTLSLSAQPPGARQITGKIIDKTTGAAIPGATITVKGTKNFGQADANGVFIIMAAPGETLDHFQCGLCTPGSAGREYIVDCHRAQPEASATWTTSSSWATAG